MPTPRRPGARPRRPHRAATLYVRIEADWNARLGRVVEHSGEAAAVHMRIAMRAYVENYEREHGLPPWRPMPSSENR